MLDWRESWWIRGHQTSGSWIELWVIVLLQR